MTNASNPTSAPASLTGNASGGGGIFGGIPDVANPVASASSAIQGDIANQGLASYLANLTTSDNATAAALPYEMNLPDYSGMLSSATNNAASELTGQLPASVANQLAMGAADRNIATGQGAGSPNSSASYLQALGLNSLGVEQQGQQNFAQLMGLTPTGAAANTASYQVTPAAYQQAQNTANVAAAAPNPTEAGIYNTVETLVGDFLGGAGKGMGGGF